MYLNAHSPFWRLLSEILSPQPSCDVIGRLHQEQYLYTMTLQEDNISRASLGGLRSQVEQIYDTFTNVRSPSWRDRTELNLYTIPLMELLFYSNEQKLCSFLRTRSRRRSQLYRVWNEFVYLYNIIHFHIFSIILYVTGLSSKERA